MDSINWYISFHRLSILPAAANTSGRSLSQSQLGMIKSERGYMIFVEVLQRKEQVMFCYEFEELLSNNFGSCDLQAGVIV